MNILSGFNLPDLSKTTSSAAATQPAQVTSASQPASGSTASSSSVSSQGDHANLSASGLAASASLASDPNSDVRLNLVHSIQSSIQAGTYNVSSSDVAGSIIKSLLGH